MAEVWSTSPNILPKSAVCRMVPKLGQIWLTRANRHGIFWPISGRVSAPWVTFRQPPVPPRHQKQHCFEPPDFQRCAHVPSRRHGAMGRISPWRSQASATPALCDFWSLVHVPYSRRPRNQGPGERVRPHRCGEALDGLEPQDVGTEISWVRSAITVNGEESEDERESFHM